MFVYIPILLSVVLVAAGIYLFLVSFNLLGRKRRKRRQEETGRPAPMELMLIMKILSVLLVTGGAYGLVVGDWGAFNDNSTYNKGWNKRKQTELVESCLIREQRYSQEHPEATRTFCECSKERIIEAVSYDEFIRHQNLPLEAHQDIYQPMTKECRDAFLSNITAVKHDNDINS